MITTASAPLQLLLSSHSAVFGGQAEAGESLEGMENASAGAAHIG